MIGRTSSTVTTRFCSLALAGRSVYSSACCLSRVPGWAGTPSMRFRWPIFGFGQCRLLGFWTSPSPKLIPDEVVVDEEILPSYEPEHFYPAHPGDVLENGYRLVVKIGWGSSSTVWLAYKTRWYNWFKPRKYVALKLCTCNISDEDIAYELDMNRHLSSANPQFPGRDVLATAFEGCTIKSPQGDAHLALVFELLREPLGLFRKRVTLRKQLDLNALPLMKAYILILLEGLDYMHSQAHVVHTDLKLDNIMVTFEHQSTITKFVQQQKSHPMPCKKLGNRTVYLCHNDFGPVMKGLGNMIPQITDFDLSQRGDKNLLIHPIQPDELRAPEVLLGTGWSYSADMWNFGVIIWELLSGYPLFAQPRTSPYSAAQHLADMIAFLGPTHPLLTERERKMRSCGWSPAATNSKGKLASNAAEFYGGPFFSDDGTFLSNDLIPTGRSFTSDLPQCVLEEGQVDLFVQFMKKMLCWLPEERATAAELLNDPWLKS